jgi:hypothetical protein
VERFRDLSSADGREQRDAVSAGEAGAAIVSDASVYDDEMHGRVRQHKAIEQLRDGRSVVECHVFRIS